jgi:hypothetical protein
VGVRHQVDGVPIAPGFAQHERTTGDVFGLVMGPSHVIARPGAGLEDKAGGVGQGRQEIGDRRVQREHHGPRVGRADPGQRARLTGIPGRRALNMAEVVHRGGAVLGFGERTGDAGHHIL